MNLFIEFISSWWGIGLLIVLAILPVKKKS